jgi:RNA polymerase sigma factor (sigma-70 family)
MPSALSELLVIELLKRCAERPIDEAAWQEFVRRYHHVIRTFVARTFHQKIRNDLDRRPQFPEDTIEDLTQTVYIKLINDEGSALERFEGEFDQSIYQYLAIIASNVVRDHFREVIALKRPKVTLSLDQLMDVGDHALASEGVKTVVSSPDAETAPTFTQEEIEALLNQEVKGRNRERAILIFKMRFFQEMSHTEIIKTLGSELTPVAISSIINRTLKRIRPILARRYRIPWE